MSSLPPLEWILTEQEEKEILLRIINNKLQLYKWKGLPVTDSYDLDDPGQFEALLKRLKIDKSEELRRNNSLKHSRILDQKKAETDLFKRKLMMEEWGYERMWTYLTDTSKELGREFELDEGNSLAVQSLCFHLSRNVDRMRGVGLNPFKGLLFMGDYGSGKTHIIKCLKDNPRHPIILKRVNDIVVEVSKDGYKDLFVPGNMLLALDDVGAEQTKSHHFKNEINWFREFLLNWYFNERPFGQLILTTNLTSKELAETYGQDVRSRMEEMFNFIVVESEVDRRKN